MTFTQETPKVAGAYWLKKHQDSAPYLCDLSIEPDGDLLLKVAGQFGYQDKIRKGGLWCLLVPHDEVEKACSELHAECGALITARSLERKRAEEAENQITTLKAKMAEEIEKAYREGREHGDTRFPQHATWETSRGFRVANGEEVK
jgi:hypothetical protein